jgi:TPR repeat protein
VLLGCAFALLATSGAAQPTTEDGIRAMLRGDYPGAARILHPLAGHGTTPDPVAEFFLAILYGAGKGVKEDPALACGLLLRSAARTHPFSEQAAALAAAMREEFGDAASLMCVADAPTRGNLPEPVVSGSAAPAAIGDMAATPPGGPDANPPVRTADAVAAVARGDYGHALEILEPIAVDWRTSDPAAQFIMAGLYETGSGVPPDPLRACALYFRATSNDDNPFGRASMAMLRRWIVDSPAEFVEECQLVASIGFDNGFEPTTFNLGPSHSVDWTLTAATVMYEGRTNRVEMRFAQPGARFLPLRYTELATGPARALPRHFIEVFLWQPSAGAAEWTLQWHLFEIVRDEIVRVETAVPLAAIQADSPPASGAFDARQYVVLRVDGEGNAEWVTVKGPHPERQRIESEAERREIREETLARDASLKQVDWKQRYDVHRTPRMAYIDGEGCGRVRAYGWTADRAEAILVRADAPDLGISVRSATFDLSRDFSRVSVEVRAYAAPQRQFDFCSDVIITYGPDWVGPETWRGVAGTVTIELSGPGIRTRAPNARRATLTLNNVVLRNGAGVTLTLPPTKLTPIVSIMPE